VQTTLENNATDDASARLVSEIFAPDGSMAGTIRTDALTVARDPREVVQHLTLAHPRLWSLQSPQLYQLRTTVLRNDRPVDVTTTVFGIRTIRFDPNHGFFLNGRHVDIQGVGCHQDFGGLGIAVPDSLQSWRVTQLKNMGANGWRTAHNPPSEALLEACDRLGMLVMDENRHLGDSYEANASPGTTAKDLSDLATMIRRDRNHPSIIMWSMCNEEKLQGTAEGAAIFTAMKETVRRLDATRPVTSAMNAGWLKPGIADVEDVIGVNYNPQQYDAIHARHPDKAMFCSEGMNQKTTRGEYVEDAATGMCSAYNLSDQPWQAVATRPFMAGTFNWTGFDYKGEPNPHGWPDVSNNTGLMDLCGFPKDKYYYFESCWSTNRWYTCCPPRGTGR
jgi:beta-galactosidase